MKTVVVLAERTEQAYRYLTLFEPLGFQIKAVNSFAPLLSCIVDPSSVLVLVEDALKARTSAHSLINQIREMPGKPSHIPIIRVWKGLSLVRGAGTQGAVETVIAPVTGQSLAEALARLGLIKQNPDFEPNA